MMRATFLLYGFLLIAGLPLYAQSGKGKKATGKAAPATAVKKPLRFSTTWGIYLSDSLPRTEVLKLLDSPLVVRDEKNTRFPVVSFDFTYEKREAYLNDTTGQPGLYTDYTGDRFKTDRLSPLWSSRLKEILQKGEALYFDNIIIKYPGDKYYKVPELRIIVR